MPILWWRKWNGHRTWLRCGFCRGFLIYILRYLRRMLLQPGEQAVYSELVETGAGATRHEGTLYLTNSRILFEAKIGKGSAGAAPATLMNVHLSYVSNVIVASPMLGRALLQIETTKGVFSFKTKAAQVWSDQIAGARARAPPPPPPKPPRTVVSSTSAAGGMPQPVVIHLHQDSAQPSVFLHCTHCGTLSPSGTSRCTSCGASL